MIGDDTILSWPTCRATPPQPQYIRPTLSSHDHANHDHGGDDRDDRDRDACGVPLRAWPSSR
jgi:hypothetical protein